MVRKKGRGAGVSPPRRSRGSGAGPTWFCQDGSRKNDAKEKITIALSH